MRWRCRTARPPAGSLRLSTSGSVGPGWGRRLGLVLPAGWPLSSPRGKWELLWPCGLPDCGSSLTPRSSPAAHPGLSPCHLQSCHSRATPPGHLPRPPSRAVAGPPPKPLLHPEMFLGLCPLKAGDCMRAAWVSLFTPMAPCERFPKCGPARRLAGVPWQPGPPNRLCLLSQPTWSPASCSSPCCSSSA